MINQEFHDKAEKYIAEGKINPVIKALSRRANEGLRDNPDYAAVAGALDRISETYRYMQEYLLKGGADAGRSELYARIREELLQQLDAYLFVSNINAPGDEFFTTYRMDRVLALPLAQLLERYTKMVFNIAKAAETEVDPLPYAKKKEEALELIFNRIRTLAPWDEEGIKVAADILADQSLPFELRSQTVSAMLLGLLKFYDRRKVRLLLDAYLREGDERVAARMLTAIVLVLDRWRGRIGSDDMELTRLLDSLAGDILTYTRLREVVMTLVRTRDTDRVSREVQEAFSKTMNRLTPDMLDRMRREGLGMDINEFGENPEWEKLMQDSDIGEKMMEINEMQLEGMDVMMQTFARLKTFPFFSKTANWFLPFSPDNTQVSRLFDIFDAAPFNMLADYSDMCASDRYSFALGILGMPQEKLTAFSGQLGASIGQLAEQMDDKGIGKKKSDFNAEALSFARDLYRFMKLNPRRAQQPDVFASPLDFTTLPRLGEMLEEEEILEMVGNFYFDHGYSAQALPLLEKVAAKGTEDLHVYEKIGYCLQMEGDFRGALGSYEKADLFSSDATPSSAWLLRKLALCTKALGDFGRSAEYYRRILERNPDDTSAEVQLGNVLLLAGDTEGGMERLSKIHYLDPDHKGCTRGYVRGLLLRGDYQSAYKAAAGMEEATDSADRRLAGHVALLAGKPAEALEHYRAARGESARDQLLHDIRSELDFLAPGKQDTVALTILLDMI